LLKNSILLAILGGAALQRCDNCIVLNAALAAEGAALAQKRLFPQPVQACRKHSRMNAPSGASFGIRPVTGVGGPGGHFVQFAAATTNGAPGYWQLGTEY
jgi:hypothetical protein